MSIEPGPSSSNPYAAPQADLDAFRVPETPADASGLSKATRGSRLAAAFIDGLIAFAAISPVIFTMGWSHVVKAGQSHNSLWFIGTNTSQIVGTALWLAVFGFQAWLITTTGQSVGKRVLGIKIVMMDGSPVGFVRGVLIRTWLVALLSFIPVIKYVGLIDLLFIFTREKRCLHDIVAGTRVVRNSAF